MEQRSRRYLQLIMAIVLIVAAGVIGFIAGVQRDQGGEEAELSNDDAYVAEEFQADTGRAAPDELT